MKDNADYFTDIPPVSSSKEKKKWQPKIGDNATIMSSISDYMMWLNLTGSTALALGLKQEIKRIHGKKDADKPLVFDDPRDEDVEKIRYFLTTNDPVGEIGRGETADECQVRPLDHRIV